MGALDRITWLNREEEIERRRGYTWLGYTVGSVSTKDHGQHLQNKLAVPANFVILLLTGRTGQRI